MTIVSPHTLAPIQSEPELPTPKRRDVKPLAGQVLLIRAAVEEKIHYGSLDLDKDIETIETAKRFNNYAFVARIGIPDPRTNIVPEFQEKDLVFVNPSLLEPIEVAHNDYMWIAPFSAVRAVITEVD